MPKSQILRFLLGKKLLPFGGSSAAGDASLGMATAVCVLRWRGAGMRFMGTVRFMRGAGCAHLRPDGLRRGKPRYTPRVCCAVGWSDSGLIYRRGMPGFFDGNGGVHVAGAWRLCLTSLTCLTSWCAPVYPEGLLAAVWYGSGEDLPSGENKFSGETRRASRRAHGQVCGGIVKEHPLDRLQQRRPATRLFLPSFFHRRTTHELICGGLSRGPPLDRSGNAPDRYMAFFAKLFFTWKKSGVCGRGRRCRRCHLRHCRRFQTYRGGG